MEYSIKRIHNVSHPNQEPKAGDDIQIECAFGFVKRVDPKTWAVTNEPATFRISADGVSLAASLQPVGK